MSQEQRPNEELNRKELIARAFYLLAQTEAGDHDQEYDVPKLILPAGFPEKVIAAMQQYIKLNEEPPKTTAYQTANGAFYVQNFKGAQLLK